MKTAQLIFSMASICILILIAFSAEITSAMPHPGGMMGGMLGGHNSPVMPLLVVGMLTKLLQSN